MTVKLQRPLLVGGAVLVLGVWVLDILQHLLGEWSVYALFAGGLGTAVWWLQQKPTAKVAAPARTTVDATAVKRALAEAEQVIVQVGTEVENPAEPAYAAAQPQIAQLQAQMAQIVAGMGREALQVTVVGAKGSGKSTLIDLIQATGGAAQGITLQEVCSFSVEAASSAETAVLRSAIAADLVLFLITGDMTDSELKTLQWLAARKRTLVIFNKQDQFLPQEQQTILARIRQQTQGVVRAGDVVAIAAAPSPIKVRQHQPDGSVKEWLEDPSPITASLTQRLDQIWQQESQQLVLASALGDAEAIKAKARTVLNDIRRARALPIVEQFQWIAAATAFASPVPTLDVLATAAINAQMILDLGAIYRQKFSLQQAQTVVTTLGTLMLKLGLVELVTRTVATLLKTNVVTYVAGGCIQGISAAYLTRVAGLTLIEYFNSQDPNLTLQEASPLAIERFSQILQSVFQQNQQLSFLQSFVGEGMKRLFVNSGTPGNSGGVTSTASGSAVDLVDRASVPVYEPASVYQPLYEPVYESATPLSPVPLPPLPARLPAPAVPLAAGQETGILEQNESSPRLSISSLDSTTLPSN